MNAVSPTPLLGTGLFPLPEAARLAQLDLRTAHRWSEGYSYRHKGEMHYSRGVMSLGLPPIGGHRDLTFAEMLTLRLVRAFRLTGLGLPTIKRVAERATQDFGIPMPFVSRRFRTDGQKVFIELREQPAANDEPLLSKRERKVIEVLTGQHQFAEVVEPSLFANVDWQDDLASTWWPLGHDHAVVLDPKVLFGAPRIKGTSIPTAALARAVSAEGGGPEAIEAVAAWFDTPPANVSEAVDFEDRWLKQAA